ncbi:hypothetical protein BN1708_003496, partial [Verticillium longisporum]
MTARGKDATQLTLVKTCEPLRHFACRRGKTPAPQAEVTSAVASVDQPTIASPKELSVDTARGSNNPTAPFILALRNATHFEKKARREKADMKRDFVRHEVLVPPSPAPHRLSPIHLPAMHKARVGWTCRKATAKLRSDCNGDRVHQSERGPQSSVIHLDQSPLGIWRKLGTRIGLTLGLRGARDDEAETTYSRVASDQIPSTTAKDDDDGDYENDRLCLGFWSLAPPSCVLTRGARDFSLLGL